MSAPTPAHPTEPAGGPPLVHHDPPAALARRLLVVPLIVTGLVVFTMVVLGTAAQGRAGLALEQCAQLDAPCDGAHPDQWVNGNLNANNSLYVEGDSVAYRALVTDLTVGATYALTIGWDTVENGKHVIDQLTAHDRSEAAADPCAGVGCVGVDDELPIPVDPQVVAAGVTPVGDRAIAITGGAFTLPGTVIANTGNLCGAGSCTITANPGPYGPTGDFAGTAQNSITVWFTASAEDAVLAWGGHIATRADWGAGNSAAAVSGSPFHMRLLDLRCSDDSTCSSGNMDRSIQSAAVVYPASIVLVKTIDGGGSGEFAFTGGPTPVADVTLAVDGPDGDERRFDGLVAPGPYTISESVPAGFGDPEVTCLVAGANGGSVDVDGAAVEVVVGEGETVTCTFVNIPVSSTSTSTSTSSTSTSTSTSSTSSSSTSTSTSTSSTSTSTSTSSTSSSTSSTTASSSSTSTSNPPTTSSPSTSTSSTSPSTSSTTATTVVAAGVTTTVYVDDTPVPIGTLTVVPQPVTPGQLIAAGLDADSTTSVAGTVVASATQSLPVSGGWSPITLLAGLGLSGLGVVLTRRHNQEDQ